MSVALDESALGTVVRRIVERFDPDKVLLFGSRARGDAREDSDYDLLIVGPSEKTAWERLVPVYEATPDIPLSIDFVWWTPEEIDDWSRVRSHFITTAVREGKTLYVKNPRRSFPDTPGEGGE